MDKLDEDDNCKYLDNGYFINRLYFKNLSTTY
jgi:hypothetical protein